MSHPIVQVAIDVIAIDKALSLAKDAINAGADWLEVGNPLIKFEGLHAVEAICKAFPDQYILVDYMILAGSKKYIHAAKSVGAKNITVSALAPDETVYEAINECKKVGMEVTVDLFNKNNLANNAKKYEEMGADYIMVHFGVDEKKFHPKGSPLKRLKEVVDAVNLPVSYATYDSFESKEAVKVGASIIVQGEPLLSSSNPGIAITRFIHQTKSVIGRKVSESGCN